MSVEFRQRTPGEYARMLWRRKWLIALPAVAVFFAVAIVVWRLPDVYQSTTLLVVRPAAMSSNFVPQLSDEDLTIRINNIGQEVVSRTSLEPLIIQYNLYAVERSRREPMDALVERMRKRDIVIELNKSRNDITNGFNLSFRAPSREQAQQVAGMLASKYVDAQLKSVQEDTQAMKNLFDQQVEQAKAQLDQLEKQRYEIMLANAANLPSQGQALALNLTGLHEEQKARIAEVGRLRDLIGAYTNQLADIEKQIVFEKGRVIEDTTDPKTTLAWAELTKRESDLQSQLQDMLTKLTPKNPDVIAAKQQLESVKRQKDQMLAEWKERIAEKEKKLAGFIDPRTTTLKANIDLARGDLQRQQALLDQTGAQIGQIEARLNRVPGAELELQRIDNQYKSLRANYDELVQKQSQVGLAKVAADKQQGEKIAVVDPASLPEKPVAPKRALLMILGLALGLGIGLLCAAVREVPRLLTIQTVEDARHYTSLPVLVAVPELLTAREQRRLKWRRTLALGAGLAATLVAIPALALLLKLTHVFELFAS
jgi:polysaccharide chain length determinant protein (PEP-CTERM system associated)